MSILVKLRCFIIGWNPQILKGCGEASFKTLKRYAAAVIILSLIWGTIGWCFADHYVGMDSLWGKIGITAAFILIIICIERFIILAVGGLGFAKFFRVFLAILMAILGSTVFDQIIFKQDVSVKMKEVRTKQINEEIPRRLSILDDDIRHTRFLMDSLGKETSVLNVEISKRPMISAYDVNTVTKQKGIDELGNIIEEKTQTINKREVENPLINQVKANEKILTSYQHQLEEYQNKRISVTEDVRREYEKERNGFLEELSALFSILLNSSIALAFYIFLFLFLFSLEMLVVTTKASTKCDYELIVEHQLNIKTETLKSTEIKLLETNKT